jgi:hypothetical protein
MRHSKIEINSQLKNNVKNLIENKDLTGYLILFLSKIIEIMY